MEKKLKKLFDYQRFEKNEKLEKLIRETESRCGGELSDDALSSVNAAGELTIPPTAPGKNAAANGGGVYQYGDFDVLDGKTAIPSGSGGGGGGGAGAGGNGTAM